MSLETDLSATSEVGNKFLKESPYEYLINFSRLKNDSSLQEELVSLIDEVYQTDGKSSTVKTKARGDKLEDLGSFILNHCGLFQLVQSNTKGNVHELDHSCEFNEPAFKAFDSGTLRNRRVLGESKNYKDEKIDVNIVYKVGAVAQFQDFGLAIIFSRKGLTGTSLTFACGITSKFRYKESLCFLVFNDSDYDILREFPFSFNIIFYEKFRRWQDHNDFNIDYSQLKKVLEDLKSSGVLAPKKLEDLLS